MPDGTEISMGSQTNFRYDPQYGKDKRVVYLEGEAFFNVAKQKRQAFYRSCERAGNRSFRDEI